MAVLWFAPVSFQDDAALVAAMTGDRADRREAERAFCERFGLRVRRYAERHLRDPQAAADLAHEVLLVVLEAIRAGRIEQPERLGSFVLSTCRHLVWDENRAEGRRRRYDREAPAGAGVEIPALAIADRSRLEHCMRHLEARERAVVLLTYCEDWPADRIASELETTPGNIRVIRHRSLSQLAHCMEASR